MATERNGDVIVAESFLEVRAKLLEIAATFDRIDRGRAAEQLGPDAAGKRALLAEAAKIVLSDEGPTRAARLQHLFSRDYQPDWREQFGFSKS